MATATSTKRLRQDYLRLQRDPVPYVEASPLPSNILEWYVRTGIICGFECCTELFGAYPPIKTARRSPHAPSQSLSDLVQGSLSEPVRLRGGGREEDGEEEVEERTAKSQEMGRTEEFGFR